MMEDNNSYITRMKFLRLINNCSTKQIADFLELYEEDYINLEENEDFLLLSVVEKLCILYNCTHDYFFKQSNFYQKPDIDYTQTFDLYPIYKMHQIMNYIILLNRLNNDV